MDELESAMNESIGITGDEARHERSYSKWIQIMLVFKLCFQSID